MREFLKLDAIWLPEEVFEAGNSEPTVDVVGLVILSILWISLIALTVTITLARREKRKQKRRRREQGSIRNTEEEKNHGSS